MKIYHAFIVLEYLMKYSYVYNFEMEKNNVAMVSFTTLEFFILHSNLKIL